MIMMVKSVALTREQMPEQRHEGEVKSSIGDAGIRCEDSEDASQRGGNKQRLCAEADGEPWRVRCDVQPKDAEEEVPERVKHLGEEVPPETHVGSEVWKKQSDAIRSAQKVPGTRDDCGYNKQSSAHQD